MAKLSIVITFLITLSSSASFPLKSVGVKTFKGEKIEKLEAGKKGTVLFFLSSTCPCSNSHMKHLNDLSKTYKDFSFIGVHSDKFQEVQVAKEYFKSKGVEFPILEDKKQIVANELEALKTPHTFVFNNKNKMVFHGGVTNSSDYGHASKFYLKDALTSLDAGKTPKKNFARALGCYIGR